MIVCGNDSELKLLNRFQLMIHFWFPKFQTSLKVLRTGLMNGEVLSPMEIPVGIPLLAKLLPKVREEEDEAPMPKAFLLWRHS